MIALAASKVILLSSLSIIFYQDIKYRAVWWFLFPAFLVSAGFLYFLNSPVEIMLLNFGLNLLVLTLILSISFLYARFKMKVLFFKEAFGIGDLFFFLGLTVAFPTLSFIVILVFCLIFSLILHLFLAHNSQQTVPLAGYASFFLILVYLSNWFLFYNNIYTY